jgi:hypothetical protein
MRARRPEIEAAALARVRQIADGADIKDPQYLDGFRGAVAATIDYGIASIERDEDPVPPVPPALLSQARLAASSGVPLETILGRYVAGYSLFGEIVLKEAQTMVPSNTIPVHLEMQKDPAVPVAIGEAAEGLAGWRQTHRQALAGFHVATRLDGRLTRYGDVSLVASMLQDELLVSSLRELYLAPISKAKDGGLNTRKTLRAYFAADRNVSSAPAALGVSRSTANNRLRGIDEKLGGPLRSCIHELEAALRLDRLL